MDSLDSHLAHVCFTTRLDRLAESRVDAQWLADKRDDPDSRYLVVWEGKLLYAAEDASSPVYLPKKALTYFDLDDEAFILLGEGEGTVYFAVDLAEASADATRDAAALLSPYGTLRDLRRAMPLLEGLDAELALFAKAIAHWHGQHRYCGVCGAATEVREAGHMRLCTGCGAQSFPRTDPAVIVIVTEGARCLLGRQESWPDGMYSALAGFVEPGESLEQTVEREVFEEAGIRLASVSYQGSQPWPFPASLMVGFRAEAATAELRVNREELEDARWFSRENIRTMVERGEMKIPGRHAIAYRLLEGWYDDGGGGTLEALSD